MADAGGTDSDVPNSVLEAELTEKVSLGLGIGFRQTRVKVRVIGVDG